MLGVPISTTLPANTKITLPGLGYVALNEQTSFNSATGASLTVNAIHVSITTANTLGLAPGPSLIVGSATSGLVGPTTGILSGDAYGTSLNVGNVIQSGQSFLEVMSCQGTLGYVHVNAGAGLTLPGVLVGGTVRNTAQAVVNATKVSGELTSSVQSATLLGGLVQSSVVKADAHASKSGGVASVTDTGSSLASLSVVGHPAINAAVPPNTTLAIPGVGTLYLNRIIKGPNSISVRMIELVVIQANSYGLAIGADLQVAVAQASVH